jgi:protein CpxP
MLTNVFKKPLLVLLAVGLISIVAAAQDSSTNPPPPPDKGGWRGGPPDPAQRTQELTKKLNLTSDQQSKVQDIFKSEQSQMQGLRQDSSTAQDDRRAKMMEIRNNTNTQVRALLDADQQKKWDEIQAKRQEWGKKGRRGGNNSGDQGAPPPSQQ